MDAGRVCRGCPSSTSPATGAAAGRPFPKLATSSSASLSSAPSKTVTTSVTKTVNGSHQDGVLVQCFAGVSRSASIIVAYHMRSEQKSLEEALEALKEISELACPNDGFLDQVFEL